MGKQEKSRERSLARVLFIRRIGDESAGAISNSQLPVTTRRRIGAIPTSRSRVKVVHRRGVIRDPADSMKRTKGTSKA